MGNKRLAKTRGRRSRLINPVVWISLAQAIWVAALVLFIVYAVDRSAQLTQLAQALRSQGLGEEGEGGWLALGVVLLSLLFVALVFITVSVTRYWSENRAIHSFVSTVSHELRTPLASIKLYLETIEAHSDLSVEQREAFIGTMLADVDRLANSIDAILAASRIERHGIQLELQPLALGELVERFHAEREVQIRLRRRELGTGALDEVSVLANREALTTVLNNLVENAVRYSKDGSEIVLSVQRDRGQARLSVADQGQGVRGKELKHLFKLFYRGSNQGGVPGTGLGLYIVQGLVKAMGGQVAIKSEGQDQGTTVTVTLPVLTAAEEQGRHPADREAAT